MSKAKDHLWDTTDLIRSVLRNVEVKALCGRSKTFTREVLDETEYFGGCKDCIERAAKRGHGEVRFGSKQGWTALLEKAWLADHPVRPSYTYSLGNVSTWNITTNWSTPKKDR